MENKIKLWGAGTTRTLRPIWMAEELGIDYALMPIGPRTGETQSKEYTDLNPKQKIPFLENGEIKLSESLAICRYLQYTFPSDKIFIPKNNIDKAKEDEWCSYIYGEIDETALYVMRRHYDLKSIYGDSPIVVKACREHLDKHLAIIDNFIKNKKSILDKGFGLADIMLISCLDWAIYYEFKLPDNIMSYRENIKKRPAFKKAMLANYKSTEVVNNGTT